MKDNCNGVADTCSQDDSVIWGSHSKHAYIAEESKQFDTINDRIVFENNASISITENHMEDKLFPNGCRNIKLFIATTLLTITTSISTFNSSLGVTFKKILTLICVYLWLEVFEPPSSIYCRLGGFSSFRCHVLWFPWLHDYTTCV